MPQLLRKINFVFNGQTGFLYRPAGQAHTDPVMLALIKQCQYVSIDGFPPLVSLGPKLGVETQAKLVQDRGTTVAVIVGPYRIPVNER